jgi:cobalt-zinc-cadmium efflux system protein
MDDCARLAATSPGGMSARHQHPHDEGHAHDRERAHDHAHVPGHAHAHAHGHSHAPPADAGRGFALGIALNLAFVGVEASVGLASGSLALIADAGHNLGDVAGLLAAWGAVWLGRRRPTGRRTYGLRRSSILIAVLNAVVLLIGMGALAWEAARRFDQPPTIPGLTVAAVALAGLLVNGATALLFRHGREHDLNRRAAFLHMAADAAVSAGVAVAGVLVWWTGARWLDPVTSLVIVAVVVWSTWGLLRDSLDLALDAVPAGVDPAAVRAWLAALPGVVTVHDLHIWAMSTTETALTAHLVRAGAAIDDALLATVAAGLRERFGIGHTTIQIESGDPAHPCGLGREGAV